MKPVYFASIVMSLAIASAAAAEDVSVARLTQAANRIVVTIGGQPFTEYYFAATADHRYVRPFLYPVLAPDGTGVTSDQINVPKGDHPHHRSIWVAHGDVNGANHWTFTPGDKQPIQRHIRFEKLDGDTLIEALEWEGVDHQPILKERRTVRFFAFTDGNRGIDFTIEFTPVDGPVKFADTKEAGLCSVRLAAAITKHATITQSTGASATGDAKSAKEEEAVWGKAADWCDESGTIDGKPYGVAILDHPSNPRHPTMWMVRLYGLLAANLFGQNAFDPSKPKEAGDLTIDIGKTVTFKYRVIVHSGDVNAAKVAEKYQEYAKP